MNIPDIPGTILYLGKQHPDEMYVKVIDETDFKDKAQLKYIKDEFLTDDNVMICYEQFDGQQNMLVINTDCPSEEKKSVTKQEAICGLEKVIKDAEFGIKKLKDMK